MDVLNDLLKAIQFKAVIYFKYNFGKPWGMAVPQGNHAQFHFVVKGQCIVRLKGGKEITLVGGDIVIFPHGLPHKIMDRRGRACMSGAEAVNGILSGQEIFTGGEQSSTLICGHYELDRDFAHPFFQSLPDYIHLNGYDVADGGRINSLLHMLVEECEVSAPGTAAISAKLAEVVFIKILRDFIRQENGEGNFFQALKEPIVSEALRLMHHRPGAAWSLENLSSEVGASRTAFFTKFKTAIGVTPMKYLAQWRIIQAKQLLRNTSASVFEVAERVGYGSEASFARAFKQQCGLTPSSFRKQEFI